MAHPPRSLATFSTMQPRLSPPSALPVSPLSCNATSCSVVSSVQEETFPAVCPLSLLSTNVALTVAISMVAWSWYLLYLPLCHSVDYRKSLPQLAHPYRFIIMSPTEAKLKQPPRPSPARPLGESNGGTNITFRAGEDREVPPMTSTVPVPRSKELRSLLNLCVYYFVARL